MGVIKTEPLFQQIIERIPPEARASLTQEQLDALQDAIAHLSWRRHIVDIRLSWLGVYLVVVGGQERRSHKRLQLERRDYPFWTAANILVLLIGFVIIMLAFIGLAHLLYIYYAYWRR